MYIFPLTPMRDISHDDSMYQPLVSSLVHKFAPQLVYWITNDILLYHRLNWVMKKISKNFKSNRGIYPINYFRYSFILSSFILFYLVSIPDIYVVLLHLRLYQRYQIIQLFTK